MKRAKAAHREERKRGVLDPRARDFIRRAVRLVHRCGASPEAIEQAAIEELRALPRERSYRKKVDIPYLPLAPELMTIWHKDPDYVDETGKPRPLSLSGSKASFRRLSRTIDPKRSPMQYLRYLISCGSVRYESGKCMPVRREVILRDITGPRDMRSLDGADAMLRTAEHNLTPADKGPGWLERTAHNPCVPARVLPAFATFLEQHSMGFLRDVDAWLHDASCQVKDGEPTREVIVGVYHSQQKSMPKERRPARKRQTAPRYRRRRAP